MPWWAPRQAPEGYLRSLEIDRNVIADPALHEYYDSLHLVTSGPIFSVARWREIIAMNLEKRDYLVKEYAARGR